MVENWDAKRFGEEVIKGGRLAVVEFYGKGGPLKLDFGSKLDGVAESFADEILFGKINTDKEEALAERYAIRSLPTLMVFWNGIGVGEQVGDADADKLSQVIWASVARVGGGPYPRGSSIPDADLARNATKKQEGIYKRSKK